MAKAQADIRSLARAHTQSCIRVLSTIMARDDAPPSARVTAAIALLDRGWGKPEQSLDLHDSRELRQYTDAELIAIIAGVALEERKTLELPAPDGSELH